MNGTSPLRQRPFALLWLGGVISDLGDWMLLVGLPIFVFDLTGSALVTSTVFIVELVPGVVVSHVAGVYADRWDKRRVLVVCNLAQAVLLMPLLIVDDRRGLWIVYVVAAVQACLAQLCVPAKAALVPRLVEPDQLVTANSINAVGDSVARLAGSPLGGVVVGSIGLSGVVTIDATTYVIAAGLTALVVVPAASGTAKSKPGGGLLSEWLDGLAVVRSTRPLPAILLLYAIAQLAQGIFVVGYVVFVFDELGAGGGEVGLLRGVQAIGGVLGGIIIAMIARRISARLLVAGGLAGLGAIALTTWHLPTVTVAIGWYVVLFVLVGAPAVAMQAGATTILQDAAPASHLGRAVSFVQSTSSAFQAIGLLLAGIALDPTGVVHVLDVQAGLYLLCALLAWTTLSLPRSGQDRRAHRPVDLAQIAGGGGDVASAAGLRREVAEDVDDVVGAGGRAGGDRTQ